MKKVFSLGVVFIIVLLSFLMCNIRGSSYGDFEKIIVFSDSTIYEEVKPLLEETFDQFIYTPHEERSFYLEFQSLSKLKTYKIRRNLIFIGLLDARDQTSKYIQGALSAEVKQALRNEQIFSIFQEDIFGTDQMVIFLSSADLSGLKKNIKEYSKEIFDRLENYHFKRLEKVMFFNGEQESIEKYLEDKFGWRIRIQYEYRIARESEDKNFFWIRRLEPDRNLFVYRFPANSMKGDSNWLINLRDSLTAVHFEGDSIDREDTYLINTEFIGKPAIELTGVWQNHKYYIGGPFKTFVFFDESSKYIYFIDICVTAPGKLKKPFLDQLEVMAKSFQLRPLKTDQ